MARLLSLCYNTFMEKKCSCCGIVMPLEKFYPQPTGRTKRRSVCIVCLKEKNRLYHEQKQRSVIRHHLTVEQYDTLLAAQGGHCNFCDERRNLVIDHDHACCPGAWSCGRCVRWIVCRRHNYALGLDPAELRSIADAIDAYRTI